MNFDWRWGAAAPELSLDAFSVRWTGKIVSKFTGTYTFHVTSDDGARPRIGGTPVIDDRAGHVSRRRREWASIDLQWSIPSQPREVVPTSQLAPR